MISTFASVLMLGVATDHLAVVRCDVEHASQKAGLIAFGDGLGASPVAAFDPSFFQYGGPQPIRFVFGVDVNGDGTDEVAVVREQFNRGGRYALTVHETPSTLYASVSGPLNGSKVASLGTAKAAGKIVAIDGVDVDGDFRDEIFVVRQSESGEQRIEVMPPPGLNGKGNTPIASYFGAGDVAVSEIVDAVGLDFDGDSIEEIALRRHTAAGDTIEIISAPKVVGDHLGAPLFTMPAPAIAGARMLATLVDSDLADDLVLWHEVDGGGSVIAPMWTSLGGPMSAAPLKTFESDASYPVEAAIILRGPTAKEHVGAATLTQALNAEFEFSFTHVINNGYYGGGAVIEVGPIAADSKFDAATGILTINVANSTAPIEGKLTMNGTSVQLTKNVIEIPLATGGKLHVVLQNLTAMKVGYDAVLSASYGTGSWTGFGTPVAGGSMNMD